MSKISEPKINRKNVREEVKREFEKEDFIYSLIGELLEHYFTLFLALWLCAGYPFIYGLSIIWQKNDIGSGSFFIFLSIVVVIIIFKIRINYKKKINQKFDKKINQLKKKYYEKQKEKKLEETIIERIGKHVKEGYIKLSLRKFAEKLELTQQQLIDIIEKLQKKRVISKTYIIENDLLILKNPQSTYKCPSCKEMVKSHWVLCPYCEKELQ